MGKRIAVLGGAGLIGTHLCLRLLEQGHEVHCVDIRDAADSPLLASVREKSGFQFINHNILNSFDLRCDEIYNLTAPSRLHYDQALPVETLKLNTIGVVNTLEIARKERTRILYASASDVYGAPYRESISEAGCRSSAKYILAEGKRAGEAFHRAYRTEHGADTRIARIFNTYGPGAGVDDQRVVMKMIVAALRNRDITVYGSGEQVRTFCWVGDLTDALIRLMELPTGEQSRTLDLGGSHEISIRMLAEKIVAVTASRSKILHIEARLDDPRRRTPDLSAAKRELGWSPSTPLSEGLKRTAEYAEAELARTAWSKMSWVEMNS